MEIITISFLFFLGVSCSFLASVLHSLSQEELNKILEFETVKSKRLQSLKLHFEESANAFLFFEIFLYICGGAIAGAYIINKYDSWLLLIIVSIILFLTAIIFRSVFSGLGSRFSNRAAIKFTSVLSILSIIAIPLVTLIHFLFHKISGKSTDEASREELNALFETAHEEGSIETDEYRILKNIMHFSDVLVSDVMTPRTVIFSCRADTKVGEAVNMPELKIYSRFPIWEGESLDDHVVGYVMTNDVLHAVLSGKSDMQLKDFARDVYIIPENAELDKALDNFLKKRQHIFVVVDEYGGVEGLLTMEDVLETILGVEIVDEADKVEDLREVAKHRRDQRIASIVSKSN